MNPILTVSFLPFLVTSFLLSTSTAQRLVAVDSNRTLYQIDLTTAQKTPVGMVSNNVGTAAAMAYDAITGTTYLASTTTDALYTLDLVTGNATLVGSFGDPAMLMHGLEFDASTAQLYGSSSHNGGLYAIDRTTGAATLLGVSGLGSITNLGYDDRTNTLFATNGSGDSLYAVDRSNGAMTLVGPLSNSPSPNALAYHSGTGVLYLLDNVADQLYVVDSMLGTAYVVGSTGPGNLLGLAFLPGGNGSIDRHAHGCGNPIGNTAILAAGTTTIGGSVTIHVGGTTGVPFVGYGLVPAAIPFCGCTVGHEWSLALLGSQQVLAVPMNATLLGAEVALQALDLFGTGGCVDPALVLSDTLVLTIG